MTPAAPGVLSGRHIVMFSWRDTGNPEGGGAERYLEEVAAGLVERGAQVTIFTAAYPGAAPSEIRDGIRFVRKGGKLSVYLRGFAMLRRGVFGRVDAVVDIQNGIPFFTKAATSAPVLVLVHHVHREQWPVVYPGLTGKVGWFVERRLAPALYRSARYIAVSTATRDELRALGVRAPIALVHNGADPALPVTVGKDPEPLVCVVGRVVPHKRVELAVDAVVALRGQFPDCRLEIVGDGWWLPRVREYVAAHGAEDFVVLHGHVSEQAKQEVFERAWVMALPSVKEGWGLVIGEAARHATPTVAFRSAGGTRESIVDNHSGLLVDTPEEFTEAIGHLLGCPQRRERLGSGAQRVAERYTWAHARAAFADQIGLAIAKRATGESAVRSLGH